MPDLKLENCPRCGGPSIEWQSMVVGEDSARMECQNNDCGLVSPYFDKDVEALAWWSKPFTRQPPAPWIAVGDGLPLDEDLPENYNVTMWNADEPDYYEVDQARYDVDGRWILGASLDVTGSVIAYMPLPPAYNQTQPEAE